MEEQAIFSREHENTASVVDGPVCWTMLALVVLPECIYQCFKIEND